jgi:predicted 2-oxoglutarate/Fe(II)-dependent dioxygenase YbiX
MHVSISNVLNADTLETVRTALAAAKFADGRADGFQCVGVQNIGN